MSSMMSGVDTLAGVDFSVILPSLTQPERIDYISKKLNQRLREQNNEWAEQFVPQFKALPSECQRDIALTIRSRNRDDECGLLEAVGENGATFLFEEYGTYVIPGQSTGTPNFTDPVVNAPDTRVIVSTPTWSQARNNLYRLNFGSSVVILPETITIAGELGIEELTDTDRVQAIVERNLDEMLKLSTLNSLASFIVGSPFFDADSSLPYNVAFHIQNGDIVGKAFKYEGVPMEQDYFSSNRERQPYFVNQSAVLICKDLGVLREGLFSRHGPHGSFRIGPETIRQFIDKDTQELLVSSCWSVGAPDGRLDGKSQEQINSLYRDILSRNISVILTHSPQLQRIIMSDRTSSFLHGEGNRPVGTKPLSFVAFKSK